MRGIFKSTVTISVVAYGILFFMPYFWGHLYDDEIRYVLQWSGYGSKIDLNVPIPYLIGIVYLITSAGLLGFQSWARTIFLLLNVALFLLAPFLGINIYGGYDAMVGQVIALTAGAIITMSYLTSISNEFNKNT